MRYFKIEEFNCRCCGGNKMDPTFLGRLDEFRHLMGFAFIVNSGYRCPKHNQSVSTTGETGPHTLGRAVDLRCSHERALRLVSHARQFGFTGVGLMQHGAVESRYIHLDDLPGKVGQPRPSIWTY